MRVTPLKKSLVIVESPAKARTIAGFLGKEYVVESSIGHIRDLPRSASDVPAAYKKTPAGELGVDVDNDFLPLYVIDSDKKQVIARLKAELSGADALYLATDEDREGESIAWHLLEVLKPKVPVHRMVFHEITRKAITAALEKPREIDRRLVEAQEARRILDRLYGYKVSPVLWRKVLPKLSAGRVQSVATRIVVERERERVRFVGASYWDVSGVFAKADDTKLDATLLSVDSKRLATGKDFGQDGKLTRDVLVLDEAGARTLAAGLENATLNVRSVERKPYKRTPSAPFMTSTLQQEAGRKLRFSTSRTMKAAQRLYESGYITYMRTDSTTLSEAALAAARTQIEAMYGKDYVPAAPRTYANKVKNAQEAHEAIRPAGDAWKLPELVSREVGHDESRVYELIWKRTVASQMQDARGESVQVRIGGSAKDGRTVEFGVSGNTITFPGFLRAYVEGSDDPDAELEGKERHLPPLAEGEALSARELTPAGHDTQPPARYTEASLVRRLEELGVGRPSTYASTLSTIIDRGYVWKKGTALVPSFTAFAVVSLLEDHFPDLVDYAFTARMEDDLDGIAGGNEAAVPWLRRFYFGSEGREGLAAMVEQKLGDIDARLVNSISIGKAPDGTDLIARVGRYGPYLQNGERTVSLPEDLAPDELTPARAIELLDAPSGDRVLGVDPETSLSVQVRAGRFGAYVQMGEASAKGEKPKTASLFKTMTPESLTLEEALKLLSIPREVGVDPTDGEVILANNGRYGPYVQKGKESRSLEAEEQIFSVTLPQALEILAKPKERGRRRAPVAPLRELGDDPTSGKPIVIKEGRFGPYATDGETIASLRRGDTIEGITPERAHELLAEKRERGPSKRRPVKKAAKKAPAKKAPAKKAAKKTAKKASTKKKAGTKKAAAKSAAPDADAAAPDA